MAGEGTRGLFPPKDFVPTSVVFGIWMAGVLAGINYFRMECPAKGRKIIAIAVAIELLVLPAYSAAYRMIDIKDNPYAPSLMSGALAIVNGLLGYYLYVLQSAQYRRWMEEHPSLASAKPYLPWWIPVVAISGLVAVVVLLFVLLTK